LLNDKCEEWIKYNVPADSSIIGGVTKMTLPMSIKCLWNQYKKYRVKRYIKESKVIKYDCVKFIHRDEYLALVENTFLGFPGAILEDTHLEENIKTIKSSRGRTITKNGVSLLECTSALTSVEFFALNTVLSQYELNGILKHLELRRSLYANKV